MKKTKLVNTRFGKMFIFKDDPTIGKSVENYGEYCYPEIELMLSLVDKDCIILDVGANIGTHTLAFAPYVSKVVAFEPDLENIELLQKNVGMQDKSISKTVILNAFALSNEQLMVSTQFDYGKTKVVPGSNTVAVPLDMIKGFPRIDLIKIDVEGMEYNILIGAKNTLMHFRPTVFIEMQDASMNGLVFDFLDSLGYTMYWMPCATYSASNYNGNPEDVFGRQHGVLNWLCTPNPITTDLEPVTDRTDTIEKAVLR